MSVASLLIFLMTSLPSGGPLPTSPEQSAPLLAQGEVDPDVDAEFDEAFGTSNSGPSEPVVTANSELALWEPISFVSGDPRSRASVRIAFGRPDYAVALPRFEYALQRQLSVVGEVGVSDEGNLLRGGARYAPLKVKSTDAFVSVGGFFSFNVADRVYPTLRFEAAAGRRLASGFQAQALLSADLLLGTSNPGYGPGFVADLEPTLALQLAYELADSYLLSLESKTSFEKTAGATSDLQSAQVFSDLSLGARYRLREDLLLGAAISLPVIHQYRWDHYGAIWMTATYLF